MTNWRKILSWEIGNKDFPVQGDNVEIIASPELLHSLLLLPGSPTNNWNRSYVDLSGRMSTITGIIRQPHGSIKNTEFGTIYVKVDSWEWPFPIKN